MNAEPISEYHVADMETIPQVVPSENEAWNQALRELVGSDDTTIVDSFISEKVDDLFKNTTCDFGIIDVLVRLAAHSQESSADIRERLGWEIGAFADRLLNDKKYRETLSGLQETLSFQFPDDGPQLCSDRNLKNLVLINEVLGDKVKQIADVFYLKNYPGLNDKLKNNKKGDVLRVTTGIFNNNGELENSVIEAAFEWLNAEEGAAPEDTARVYHTFFLSREKQGGALKRRVNLDLIEMPSSLKMSGVATKMLRDSVRVYDTIGDGIDEITLHADINVGAYAWAGFGFGWEFETMKKEMKQTNEAECIREIIVNAKGKLLRALKENNLFDENSNSNDPAIVAIIETYDRYLNNPLAVTPQMLAVIGKDGPFFRRDEYGKWREERAFFKLQQESRGTEEELKEHVDFKGRFHAGKLAMVATSLFEQDPTKWYGKLNLKDRAQRAVLDKAFERRS